MSHSALNLNQTEARLLSIDPGTNKWGYVIATVSGEILVKGCFPQANFPEKIEEWKRAFSFQKIILGKGTAAQQFLPHLKSLGEVAPLDESFSTLEARKLYWQDHPRRGLRRLIPASFQIPPEPYDDYAALALLKRYLKTRS